MGLWKTLIQEQLENGQRSRSKGNSEPVISVGGSYYFDIAGENEVIEKWIPKVRRALRSSARWFTDGKEQSFVLRPGRGEKKLAESIGSYTKKDFGAITKVAFKFERHGVFVHKGVGRGYNARGNGFVMRTAKGEQERPRIAVEWFNPVLDKYLPELADNLAKVNADAAINATKMKIN